jgi:hypothetical protein
LLYCFTSEGRTGGWGQPPEQWPLPEPPGGHGKAEERERSEVAVARRTAADGKCILG